MGYGIAMVGYVRGIARVGHDVETKLLLSPTDPPAKGILVLG